MSRDCLHWEGWGCRRCRRDYGEQMPDAVLELLHRSFVAIGSVPDSIKERAAQNTLKNDIAVVLLKGRP